MGEGCGCPLLALVNGRVTLSASPRCEVHGPAVRAQRDQFVAELDALDRQRGERLDAMAAAAATHRSTLRSRLWARVRRGWR